MDVLKLINRNLPADRTAPRQHCTGVTEDRTARGLQVLPRLNPDVTLDYHSLSLLRTFFLSTHNHDSNFLVTLSISEIAKKSLSITNNVLHYYQTMYCVKMNMYVFI